MGFKDFLVKMKDGVAKGAITTKRYNSSGFLGNVDRGLTNGDFGQGTYLNLEKSFGIIYGINIEDYTFTADDIAKFEVDEDCDVGISKGQSNQPAKRCIVTFKDGKKAQIDIFANRVAGFKKRFGLD